MNVVLALFVFRHLLFSLLLHGLLKVNLKQDKFSLLDEGRFFFVKGD